MKSANNRFAELVLQNNISPKKIKHHKKINAYVAFNEINKVWWKYYKNTDILSLSHYAVDYLGDCYEKSLKEQLYKISTDSYGNIVAVNKI